MMTKILLLLLDNHHWKWRADTYKVEIFSAGYDIESDGLSSGFTMENHLHRYPILRFDSTVVVQKRPLIAFPRLVTARHNTAESYARIVVGIGVLGRCLQSAWIACVTLPRACKTSQVFRLL
jgi:hypothetical protein